MDVTRLVSSSVENKYYFAEPNLIELGKTTFTASVLLMDRFQGEQIMHVNLPYV